MSAYKSWKANICRSWSTVKPENKPEMIKSHPHRCFLCLRHAHKNTVMEVKWNLNGNWLLTASRDHLCKLFDIRNLKEELQVFRGHKKEATGRKSEVLFCFCFVFLNTWVHGVVFVCYLTPFVVFGSSRRLAPDPWGTFCKRWLWWISALLACRVRSARLHARFVCRNELHGLLQSLTYCEKQ